MSIQEDIIDGSLAYSSRRGLIYTEVMGWVDLGHAQGVFLNNVITDSGFSGEDLVSDLLGFYRIMSCIILSRCYVLLAKRKHSSDGTITGK